MRNVVWLAVLCLLVPAAASALEVPLTVSEPAGVARSEVVSGGIPLPEGQFKDPAAFSLFDGTTEVPVQVSPMVKYPDGSLHWVLVSFPVELAANGSKTFTLKDGPSKAAPANPVTVKEDGGQITVSNGLVGLTVNKDLFNGIESISYQGKEVFKAAKAGLTLDAGGGPAKPILCELRYRGPLRTTLYVKGRFGEAANPSYAMAVTLTANSPVIHIDHNLRNAAQGSAKMQVTTADIRLGMAGQFQPDKSGQGATSPASFGWQSFTGPAELLVFMRHGGPGNKGVYKVEPADGELAIRLNPGDGPYGLAMAAHKITEIDLVFGGKGDPQALAGPLHALADCAWYSEQDGMGVGRGFGSLADETQTYKNMGLSKADDPKKMPHEEKAKPDMYIKSMPGQGAHFTSECDHLGGLVIGYVRSGQRGFWDQAHAWARYWQTYFLYRSDDFLYGKEGSFKTAKWGDGSTAGRCCTEGCHFYAIGMFDYALLTGNIDALESAFDAAEFANLSWYGQYSGKKPGQNFSAFGSRGFTRCYLVIARAYDVARAEPWRGALLHYVAMATRTPVRDPRGFTSGGSPSPNDAVKAAQGRDKDSAVSDMLAEMVAKEKVTVVEEGKAKFLVHPTYGRYQPKSIGSWPESMELMANLITYEAAGGSSDPELQLAAEDAMDYAIAEAYCGVKYCFDPVQKAIHPYVMIDYPLPDFVPLWKGGKWTQYQPTGTDSWYTKWWPGPLAAGYKLTGDKMLLDKTLEVAWWGVGREYTAAPMQPQGEAPMYSRVLGNTKGDYMSQTALAYGVGARPKKDIAPPEAVKDLAAKALGGGKVELTWTEPASADKLAKFQVKHADKPIKDYFEIDYRTERDTVCYWNMATNVVGEPAPKAAGAKQTLTLTVPTGKRSFAVKSFDADHRISKLGNVVEIEVN